MFKPIFILGFICLAQASVITLDAKSPLSKTIEPREQDIALGEAFIENFYEGCGTISTGESNSCIAGAYCPETIKRCIGDRDDCIENKNCYFALSIVELAEYVRYNHPSNGSFFNYTRVVQRHEVTILDTCHMKPQAEDEVPNNKLIAVGVAVPNPTNATKPRCEIDNGENETPTPVFPSLDDYRGYFFVSNFTQCNFDSGLPVHPADVAERNPETGNIIDTIPDPIRNTLTYEADDWQPACNRIVQTVPAALDIQRQSHFLRYFALTYYGTPDPMYSLAGGFSITDSSDVQKKAGQVFLYPKAVDREPTTTTEPTTVTEEPTTTTPTTTPEPTTTAISSGILFKPSSPIITITATLILLGVNLF